MPCDAVRCLWDSLSFCLAAIAKTHTQLLEHILCHRHLPRLAVLRHAEAHSTTVYSFQPTSTTTYTMNRNDLTKGSHKIVLRCVEIFEGIWRRYSKTWVAASKILGRLKDCVALSGWDVWQHMATYSMTILPVFASLHQSLSLVRKCAKQISQGTLCSSSFEILLHATNTKLHKKLPKHVCCTARQTVWSRLSFWTLFRCKRHNKHCDVSNASKKLAILVVVQFNQQLSQVPLQVVNCWILLIPLLDFSNDFTNNTDQHVHYSDVGEQHVEEEHRNHWPPQDPVVASIESITRLLLLCKSAGPLEPFHCANAPWLYSQILLYNTI